MSFLSKVTRLYDPIPNVEVSRKSRLFCLEADTLKKSVASSPDEVAHKGLYLKGGIYSRKIYVTQYENEGCYLPRGTLLIDPDAYADDILAVVATALASRCLVNPTEDSEVNWKIKRNGDPDLAQIQLVTAFCHVVKALHHMDKRAFTLHGYEKNPDEQAVVAPPRFLHVKDAHWST